MCSSKKPITLIFFLQFDQSAYSQEKTLFVLRPDLVALWNNFLVCIFKLTINVRMVGGGSEENVNSCDYWFLLTINGAGKMSIIHKKWHKCCLHTHKNVMCIKRKHRLHICKEFLFCHLFFNFSLKNLWYVSICAGVGGGGGLAILLCSFSRALRSQTSCLSFSAAHQQLHVAKVGCLPRCNRHSCPGTVWLSVTLFRLELSLETYGPRNR